MNPQRRRLLLAGLAGLLPRSAWSAAAARVLVVGGGFGGASCARALRRLAPEIEVTLIEPRAQFFTGPWSNAAIASVCAEGDIVRGPRALTALGVRWVQDRAVDIDPVRRRVRTAGGMTLEADHLVLSPGVAMRWERIEGLDEANSAAMPHAWLGDAQVSRLRDKVEALRDGATVVIAPPANPYRCPPAPYERASLLAWRLSSTRRRCKILLLDAKDDFAKRPLFEFGWDTLYPGLIEWVPRSAGGELMAVDVRRHRLRTSGATIHADLACVIPPQRAADIARQADLVDETGWCPVDGRNFESTRHAGIHVIGDAAAAQPMPKSAFSANSQAKLVALSIRARQRGLAAPEVKLVNTCYSLLAPGYTVSVGGLYGVVSGRLNTLNDAMSPIAAPRETRRLEAHYAQQWYEQITRDSFG